MPNGDGDARLDCSDYPGYERTCGECDRWGWISHATGFCWDLELDKPVVRLASDTACGNFIHRRTRGDPAIDYARATIDELKEAGL